MIDLPLLSNLDGFPYTADVTREKFLPAGCEVPTTTTETTTITATTTSTVTTTTTTTVIVPTTMTVAAEELPC
jgi:hypothetical protein